MNTNYQVGRSAVVALIAALILVPSAQAKNPGYWTALSVGGYLDTNKTFKLNVKEEGRFDAVRLQEVHSQISLGWKATDWLEIAPRFHLVNSYNDSKDSWKQERRYGSDFTFSYDLFGFKLSDRNRIVWRDFDASSSDDKIRYRNRIQVVTPWKWTEYKINPYASFEGFYDRSSHDATERERFSQTRTIVGVKAKLTENWGLDVFYLLQEKYNKSDRGWDDNHIGGIELSYKF